MGRKSHFYQFQTDSGEYMGDTVSSCYCMSNVHNEQGIQFYLCFPAEPSRKHQVSEKVSKTVTFLNSRSWKMGNVSSFCDNRENYFTEYEDANFADSPEWTQFLVQVNTRKNNIVRVLHCTILILDFTWQGPDFFWMWLD